MIKTFISYHHGNDQGYKNHLSKMAENFHVFEDCSVEVGDISDEYSSEKIRRIIRDEYLKDTKVTILLCGSETRFRKHIDWELKSSMIDGSINRRSGILIINLPTAGSNSGHAGLPNEKENIYWDYTGKWTSYNSKQEYKDTYPMMPERIIDNLMKPDVEMSIVPWSRIKYQPRNLRFLIEATDKAGQTNKYDMSLPMRRKNYNP